MTNLQSSKKRESKLIDDKDINNHELITLINQAKESEGIVSFWKLRKVFYRLYIQKLTNTRDTFPKYLGYISFSSIFIFSIVPTLLHYFFDPFKISGYINLLIDFANAIVGISSSLLAAVFIDLSFRLRDEYHKIANAIKLKNLLSCDVFSKSVVIVLPKYPMAINKDGVLGYIKEVYRDAHDDDYVNLKKSELNSENSENIDENMHYFSTLAYQDVIAAANIISMFERGNLPRPLIKTDVEILANLIDVNSHKMKPHSKSNEVKTYICVGLFSNEISMWINKHIKESSSNGKFFKFDKNIVEKDPKVENLGHIQLSTYKGNKVEYGKWTHDSGFLFTGHAESKSDYTSYALFSKVIIEDTSFIIMGGLTARATKEMGKYLKNNWEIMCNYIDEKTNIHLGDNPFAMVYRIIEEGITDKVIRIDTLKKQV